jgi:hypothetical protein
MGPQFRFSSMALLAALFNPMCSEPPVGGAGGAGGAGGGSCATDADCRTFSDYCTGCDCRALSRTERDPVCPGPGVQCLVDPCDRQRAVCSAGRCALAPATAKLQWFATCGDPVCRGYTPKPGVPRCTDQQVAGAACSSKDQTCDPQSDCNALLRCTDTDPAVNCPISRREFKDDIEYVNDNDLQKLAEEVARLKLARYHYKADAAKTPRLGFIIQDRPGSPAVQPDRDRVDLYAYTSMAVAALQVQTKQLRAQQQQIEALQRQITALERARSCRPAR